MNFLEYVLFPLIFVMKMILEANYYLFGSYGIAIIMLSIIVTIATSPISKWAERVQEKETALRLKMKPEIEVAKAQYKGEQRFFAIEKIYGDYNYHPIHSLKSIVGILPQIPFLLSALFLLWHYPPLVETGFLILTDLSQVDGLIGLPEVMGANSINLLPVIMALFSIAGSFVRPDMDLSTKINVWIVSLGLSVLVYSLPSAVLLYWTSNNLISLLLALFNRRSAKKISG